MMSCAAVGGNDEVKIENSSMMDVDMTEEEVKSENDVEDGWWKHDDGVEVKDDNSALRYTGNSQLELAFQNSK